MEFYLFFPVYLILAIYCSRHKRIWVGDFIEIRWKNQPILFVLGVVVLYLCALDGFCNIVALFERFPSIQPYVLSKEKLELLDAVTASLFVIDFAVVPIFARKFTIKKKDYTWKETPWIRGAFGLICLLIFVFCIEDYIDKISSLIYL